MVQTARTAQTEQTVSMVEHRSSKSVMITSGMFPMTMVRIGESLNVKATGEMGRQVPKAKKGDKGDQGEQGIQGVQGEKGDKGDQGEQGIQGVQGEKGDKG